MSNDTQVKQQDINAIHNLFYEYHYADDLGVIKSKLAEYVATAREEAREAAFTAMALELRKYGPNIRRVDLLARFQGLFRETAASGNKEQSAAILTEKK